MQEVSGFIYYSHRSMHWQEVIDGKWKFSVGHLVLITWWCDWCSDHNESMICLHSVIDSFSLLSGKVAVGGHTPFDKCLFIPPLLSSLSLRQCQREQFGTWPSGQISRHHVSMSQSDQSGVSIPQSSLSILYRSSHHMKSLVWLEFRKADYQLKMTFQCEGWYCKYFKTVIPVPVRVKFMLKGYALLCRRRLIQMSTETWLIILKVSTGLAFNLFSMQY